MKIDDDKKTLGRSGLAGCAVVLMLASVPLMGQSANRDPEAVSASGRLLFAQTQDENNQTAYDAVEAARTALNQARGDQQFRAAVLDLGGALDEVWRYREAVSVYSRGLSRFANDGELFLRRGTSSMRLRNFDRSLEDLRDAARRAPQLFESHYRYGLALFLTRDFRRCIRSMEEAETLASNDDERIAALHWGYSCARRANRRGDAEDISARVPDEMDLEQNSDYFLLMQMYFGRLGEYAIYNQDAPASERSSTRGFGIANWHLWTGGEARAKEILEVVARGEDWPAIGVLAAESELQGLAE